MLRPSIGTVTRLPAVPAPATRDQARVRIERETRSPSDVHEPPVGADSCRVELLTEWDQRLETAIAAELNQSQMWADLAGDTAPHDPEGATGFIDAASECLTVAAHLRDKRAQAANMIRLASTEPAD